jgi:hypothetical protein
MPRELLHLLRQRGHVVGDARVLVRVLARVLSGPGSPRPRVQLFGRMAEGAARVPQRHPRPVGDHVGDLGGPVTAVGAVDVLDHLLAAPVLDVQIDIGRAVPPADRNRSNSRPWRTASTLVMPSA